MTKEYDPYDSSAYYQDSAPYNHKRYNFPRPKPKQVETAQDFRQTFVLPNAVTVFALEANTEEITTYQTLKVPANHPFWKGKMWSASERELIDCYQTRIDGKVYCFMEVNFFDDSQEPVPVSMARAVIMQLAQFVSGNR